MQVTVGLKVDRMARAALVGATAQAARSAAAGSVATAEAVPAAVAVWRDAAEREETRAARRLGTSSSAVASRARLRISVAHQIGDPCDARWAHAACMKDCVEAVKKSKGCCSAEACALES